jgi:rare lipoprotein A (peptidoglycan hydrolase)
VDTTPHGRVRKRALALSMMAAAAAVPAIAPADAEAAAIKLKVDKHVLVGKELRMRGLLDAPAGQKIRVQRSRGGRWRTIETVKTGSDGRFKAQLPTRALGKMRIRALGPDGTRSENRRAIAYRTAAASYYGPGLYGNRTACGRTLTPSTVGVANKSLPCGTPVRLHYRGRTVRVRVIDRGPYAGNREYDLTEATKRRLGFGSTGNVWTTK